jgi:hypothetical protein
MFDIGGAEPLAEILFIEPVVFNGFADEVMVARQRVDRFFQGFEKLLQPDELLFGAVAGKVAGYDQEIDGRELAPPCFDMGRKHLIAVVTGKMDIAAEGELEPRRMADGSADAAVQHKRGSGEAGDEAEKAQQPHKGSGQADGSMVTVIIVPLRRGGQWDFRLFFSVTEGVLLREKRR